MNPNAVLHIPMPSGKWLPLINPKPKDIDFRDIAEMLAKQNRFAGSTTNCTYSVAQHSCHISDHLPPQYRLMGLLHDAHEAPLNDWTTPLKNAIRVMGGAKAMVPLELIEDGMASAIHRKAGLAWPLTDKAKKAVKMADNKALATEVRDLMTPSGCASSVLWQDLSSPWTHTIKPWPWARAADEWLKRFSEYTENPAYAEGAA